MGFCLFFFSCLLLFYLEGFKGQVRWPFEQPHLTLKSSLVVFVVCFCGLFLVYFCLCWNEPKTLFSPWKRLYFSSFVVCFTSLFTLFFLFLTFFLPFLLFSYFVLFLSLFLAFFLSFSISLYPFLFPAFFIVFFSFLSSCILSLPFSLFFVSLLFSCLSFFSFVVS